MADQPTFKEVLQQVVASADYETALEYAHWDKALPAFVARWRDSKPDVWDKFAERCGKPRPECFNRLAWCGILEFAKVLAAPPEMLSPKISQQWEDKFFRTAKSLETAAKYYRECDLLDDEDEAFMQQCEQRAKGFRLHAAAMKPSTLAGRYQKDSGKRTRFSKAQRLLMQGLGKSVQRHFGELDLRVVTEITNLAYEGLNAESDYVGKICRAAKPEVAHIK